MRILPDDMWECSSAEGAATSWLAESIWQAVELAKIFLHDNMVVVTKKQDQEWTELVPKVEEAIKSFLLGQKPLFKTDTKDKESMQDEYAELIQEVIRDYIQPAVASDGGLVRFASFENGIVKISMHGACEGCPSSEQTLRDGIERIIKFRVPEVIGVELV
jgi:Fe-S cluster biogenesis protein NfuA